MSGSLDRFAIPCFERFSSHDERSESKERKSDFEWSEDERNHIAHPQMTPVHEEAKLGGKAYVGFPENADSVPMVEKAVATGWKKETSVGKISASNGALPHSEKHKSAGVQAQLVTWLMTFLGPPPPTPGFTEADLLSLVLGRLDELEEKVETLQRKPSEMPYEKEELLDATVRRVDALEAELIATKKALHEVLRRQEELLAYIDREEDAKFRKKKLCF